MLTVPNLSTIFFRKKQQFEKKPAEVVVSYTVVTSYNLFLAKISGNSLSLGTFQQENIVKLKYIMSTTTKLGTSYGYFPREEAVS